MQHCLLLLPEELRLKPRHLSRCALTIAGSDSCGGAGIQADLKTFAAFGVYGASVVSALTAQNTLGVCAVQGVTGRFLVAQLDAVLEDLPVTAIKTGMLPNAAAIRQIATRLTRLDLAIPLVVDPVLVATSGAPLVGKQALETLRQKLFPITTLATPNLVEAAVLTGRKVASVRDMEAAGHALLDMGCAAVLMKGGHLSVRKMTDLLITPQGIERYSHPARPGQYHGTGCTLSAAIAAGLAKGEELGMAVETAIRFVQSCIHRSRRPRKGSINLLGWQPIDR